MDGWRNTRGTEGREKKREKSKEEMGRWVG